MTISFLNNIHLLALESSESKESTKESKKSFKESKDDSKSKSSKESKEEIEKYNSEISDLLDSNGKLEVGLLGAFWSDSKAFELALGNTAAARLSTSLSFSAFNTTIGGVDLAFGICGHAQLGAFTFFDLSEENSKKLKEQITSITSLKGAEGALKVLNEESGSKSFNWSSMKKNVGGLKEDVISSDNQTKFNTLSEKVIKAAEPKKAKFAKVDTVEAEVVTTESKDKAEYKAEQSEDEKSLVSLGQEVHSSIKSKLGFRTGSDAKLAQKVRHMSALSISGGFEILVKDCRILGERVAPLSIRVYPLHAGIAPLAEAAGEKDFDWTSGVSASFGLIGRVFDQNVRFEFILNDLLNGGSCSIALRGFVARF